MDERHGKHRALATLGGWIPLVLVATDRGDLAVHALLALAWLALLCSATTRREDRSLMCVFTASLAVPAIWVRSADDALSSAAVLAFAVVCGRATGPLRRFSGGRLALAAVPGLALPAVLSALVYLVGDGVARTELLRDWALAEEGFSVRRGIAAALAVAFGWAVVSLTGSRGDGHEAHRTRADRLLAGAAIAVAAVVVLHRARVIASFVPLPENTLWSEAPLQLNLLKLRAGAPFYGPLTDCNSYSYSPTLELVHHAILAPFGLDLSLVANRTLILAWHVATVAILTRSLAPSWVSPTSTLGARIAVHASLALVVAGAVGSSLVAGRLHPDALLFVPFALALALALREGVPESSRLALAGFVLVPIAATAIKLTGAGVGLGLVLAFARPRRRRVLLALGLAGFFSLATIPLFDATLGPFSVYAIRLQASQPLAPEAWRDLLSEPSVRVFAVALLAFACSSLAADRLGPSLPACARALLVTVGFAAPSILAYVKVGGRSNSVTPLAIGGVVVLLRLGGAALRASGRWSPGAAAVALAVSVVTPAGHPVSAAEARAARAWFDDAVARVQGETRAGHRTLLYEATSPWIAAGRVDVPLDRWQTVTELALARFAAVDAHFARLEGGAYDSLLLSDKVLDPRFNANAARLRAVIDRAYVRDDVAREGSTLDVTEAPHLPPVVVYRWRPPSTAARGSDERAASP